MEFLPAELHVQIFKDLDHQSARNMSMVSKRVSNTACSEDVWKHIGSAFSKRSVKNEKIYNSKRLKKYCAKKRMDFILGNRPVCTRCRIIIARSSISRLVERTYGKKWCFECCKDLTICHTSAIDFLVQESGMKRKQAIQTLNGLLSIRCSMKNSPGTYYLLEVLQNF